MEQYDDITMLKVYVRQIKKQLSAIRVSLGEGSDFAFDVLDKTDLTASQMNTVLRKMAKKILDEDKKKDAQV